MNNKKSLLIQPRSKEYGKTLDFFPTPGYCTRALFKYVAQPEGIVHEPAAGNMHMSNILTEHGCKVISNDIQYDNISYLDRQPVDCDWVVTNPPYKLGTKFAIKALEEARLGVAFFVRYTFLESVGRYEKIYRHSPPSTIGQFSQRVGLEYSRTVKDQGSAVAYAWVVWDKRKSGTEFIWIPPCKDELAKPEDWY